MTPCSLVWGYTYVPKEHAASIFRVELRPEEMVRLCGWVARKVSMGGGGGKETDLHPDPTDFFHEDGGSKLL
jgi:hypothetical protein